jgi:hypothetical protein
MKQMRGHYFFKWLFLTVLSVSFLHLREVRLVCYQTEQVAHYQGTGARESLLVIGSRKLSVTTPPVFADFKNTQHILLAFLSFSLSHAAGRRHDFQPDKEPGHIFMQNQHFRSRTFSSDEHSIFHS